MPPSPAGKKSSGMSFMPKGSSLSRNIRRAKDENIHSENRSLENRSFAAQQDDYSESSVSDEGSKYSYEDSGDEMDRDLSEKNLYGKTGSVMSPAHSTYESPEAVDINTLVHLNSKLPSGREVSARSSPLQALSEKGPPSLSLRKTMQPTSLKPLQPTTKKKVSPKKKAKNLKASSASKYEVDESGKAAEVEEEQRSMLEIIRKEWAAMQEEFEREEKAKYEKMVQESSKKLEEEETLIRKEHSDYLSKLKRELEKKIEDEKNAAEKNLAEIKKSNELLYSEEEQTLKKKLDALTEERTVEINEIKEKNEKEINEKKIQLDEEMKKEVELLKKSQENKLKELKESHSTELDLVEKAHMEKMKEVNLVHSKEINGFKSDNKNEESLNSESSQLEVDKIQQLLEEKRKEQQKLSDELILLENKVKSENEALRKLEEKISASQTYYEEIQDEVDKTENDLDLLRTEKSTLISELSILKENINNEKSNLHNIESRQDVKALSHKHVSPKCENKAINTEVIITTLCQAIQTYVDIKDAFCQITEVIPLKHDISAQTVEIKLNTFEKSCQVDLVEDLNNKNVAPAKLPAPDLNEVTNISVLINKSLENALSSMTNKMDERFKMIEKHIGSVSQNATVSDDKASSSGTFNILKTNHNAEAQGAPTIYDLNVPHSANINDIFVTDASYRNPVISSQNTCSCVQGDADSCDVMQEVKSSIYRLNDILGQTFMPTLNNRDVIPQFNQSLMSYSSPLDTFYTQFRQLQEKQRVTNLKHKCQNEVKRQLRDSTVAPSRTNQLNDLFKTKDYSKPNNIENTNIYAIEFPDDPLMRARNLVMKEKARSWKQTQLLHSSLSQTYIPSENHFSLSDNASYSISSRTSPGLSEVSPSGQYPFLNFDSDPESDYNSWMLRLNSLQQRIRSHKFI